MLDVSKIAVQIASEFTGSKAFKQAETATQKLERQVKNLGRSLGLALGAAAIVRFGKASVKAFAEDEKAARSLSLALANTGNAFASIEVEKFIGDLQRTTGVLDDELRPAFQTLLTVTGNVKKSQDGLSLALDVAAGTTKSLSTVSFALAKAYGGQTTALNRLVPGLDKALLATGDMDKITEELSNRFNGQALAAVEGYAGQMALLTIAVEDAKEAIGEGLVGALNILSGGGNANGSIEVIDKMAKGIAEGAKNIAFMIKQFEALKPVIIAIGALLLIYFAPITAAVAALAFILAKGGENLRKSKFNLGPAQQSPGERIAIDKANAAAKKKADKDAIALQKTQNDLKKIDNANTTRKLALTGDELALKELEKKFDVERIGLFAALNNATDSETQLRLKSLIAIHDQNTALAGQIMKTNQAAEAMEEFGKSLYGAIGVMLNFGQFAIGERDTLRAMGIGVVPENPGGINPPNYGALDVPLNAGSFRIGERDTMRAYENASIVVNVGGSVTTERDLVNAITQGIYNNQASGIPINYSTAY